MKKYFIQIIFLLLYIKSGNAQSVNSVANGNWNNPNTWSCACVPTSGFIITINHQVTLNTNYSYSSGSIIIAQNASLSDGHLGKNLTITGGTLANNGNIDVKQFTTQNGSFSNFGSIKASIFLNYLNFFNNGTFYEIDSISNYALITNNGNFVNIGIINNSGIYTNNMKSEFIRLTNNGMITNNNYMNVGTIYNNGMLTNRDSLLSTNNILNEGRINNDSGANLHVEKKLSNKSNTNFKASIINNGYLKVIEHLSNYDTLSGATGYYEVQDTSTNYGYMAETFTFCDHTPISSSPYIDYNYDYVSPDISWCIATTIQDVSSNSINIYPNPARSNVYIDIFPVSDFTLSIYDALGNLISDFSNNNNIDLANYSNGIYLFEITYGDQLQRLKIIVSK